MPVDPADRRVFATGSPDNRPSSAACFSCGRDTEEDPVLPVRWVECGVNTFERLCGSCRPHYAYHLFEDGGLGS